MKFSNLLHSMSKSNILQKEDVITNGKRGRVCFPKTRATGYKSYQAQIDTCVAREASLPTHSQPTVVVIHQIVVC